MSQPGQADKSLIVHCSDLHFGHGFQPHLAEKLLERIGELHPQLVVVSGDLTMRARASQFAQAREFLKRIPAPLLLIPGNHDVPLYNLFARLIRPFDNYVRFTADLGTNPVQAPGVSLYGINSINPHRHQQGRFTSEHLHAVTRWLADQPAASWRVVVAHQHFVAIPGFYRPGAMRHAAKVLSELQTAGTHAILCGHMHFKYIGSTRDFFPQLERPIALIHAGTATSRRLRGKVEQVNNFNVLEFDADRFAVTPYDWNTHHGNFLPGEHSVFDRAFFGESTPEAPK